MQISEHWRWLLGTVFMAGISIGSYIILSKSNADAVESLESRTAIIENRTTSLEVNTVYIREGIQRIERKVDELSKGAR